MASKACEKRVMLLDPAMRNWKITVKDINCYENLAKAKVKHLEDGIFPHIQLTVDFTKIRTNSFFFADSIMNHWKTQIVVVHIALSGKEYFLLDPDFILPNIKRLVIARSKENQVDVEKFSSALIQHNADTLESLVMGDNVEVSLTEPLKLKELEVGSLNSASVTSLLGNSSKTLESLELTGPTLQSQTILCCPELKLKKLVFFRLRGTLPPSVQDMISILKACQHTLKTLAFHQINVDFGDELNSIQLSLKDLCYEKSNISDLSIMLKANSSTLKRLFLRKVPEETLTFDDGLQLYLESFDGDSIPGQLALHVIKASEKTMTELTLESVKDNFDVLNLNKLQLKKLYLKRVNSNNVAQLISVSDNLEELTLVNIHCTNEIGTKLGKLKILECEKTCINLTENLTKLANLSLTELEVVSPRTCECVQYPKYDLGNLTEFDCKVGSPEYVAKILNSSYKTLRVVCISKLKDGKFTLENDLNLKRFEAVDIDTSIVTSVLKNQASTLNKMVLQNVKKDGHTNDSALLRVLVEFRTSNPHCLVEIKDEDVDKFDNGENFVSNSEA